MPIELDNKEINIDDIPIREVISFDASKYQGFKIKIDNVWIDKNAINFYNGPLNSEGRPSYNSESKETMWKVIIETYPLPLLDEKGDIIEGKYVSFKIDDKNNPISYRVSTTFNLTYRDGAWGISKNSRALLWKFMRKMGATKLSELKDKIVILDTAPDADENSDRVWLRISK